MWAIPGPRRRADRACSLPDDACEQAIDCRTIAPAQQLEERRVEERLQHRSACRITAARVPHGAENGEEGCILRTHGALDLTPQVRREGRAGAPGADGDLEVAPVHDGRGEERAGLRDVDDVQEHALPRRLLAQRRDGGRVVCRGIGERGTPQVPRPVVPCVPANGTRLRQRAQARREIGRDDGDVRTRTAARVDLVLDEAVAAHGDAETSFEAQEHRVGSHAHGDATRSPPGQERAGMWLRAPSGGWDPQHLARAHLVAGTEPVGEPQRLDAHPVSLGNPGECLSRLHPVRRRGGRVGPRLDRSPRDPAGRRVRRARSGCRARTARADPGIRPRCPPVSGARSRRGSRRGPTRRDRAARGSCPRSRSDRCARAARP